MSNPPTSPDELPYAAAAEVRDHCLCLHAQRAARALARRFDAELRPFGITSGQFSLMMALNRPKPAPMRAVAELLAMDRTTLTAALKPLLREGLAVAEADPADRRARLLSLTAKGRARLARALPVWRETHAEIDRRLDRLGGQDLRGDLRVISQT